MASVAEQTYFPHLDECLRGEKVVLSWRLIAEALCDVHGNLQTNPTVVGFLRDDHVQRLILDPASAFAPPDNQTKSKYETRTSAVNFTPSADGKYDVNAIRAHATWLSDNVGINLVAALRIVAIEFQARATAYLAGPLSSQDVANLREAAGLGNGQDTVLVSTLGSVSSADAESLWDDFEKESSVKRRIFGTYLSERRSLMMVADHVNCLIFYRRLPIHTPVRLPDLPELYHLRATPDPKSAVSTKLKVFADLLQNLGVELDSFLKDEAARSEELEIEWVRTCLTEVAHALSMLFHVLDSLGKEFSPSAAVGEWFSLMEDYMFLDKLEPITESILELIHPVQALVVVISLSFLRPLESLRYFDGERDDLNGGEDSYLASSDVLETIHRSITTSANTACECSLPATFVWSCIIHRMYVSLNERLEKRDNLLHQNARETFEGSVIRPTNSRRNSGGSLMSIEALKFDSFLQNSGLDKDVQIIEQLARAVMANGRVYEVMTTITRTAADSNQTSLPMLPGHRIRAVFLDFIKACYPVVGYQSEPVGCLVSVLTVGSFSPDRLPAKGLSASQDITDVALQDEELLGVYLEQSLARFPAEFLPFIQLSRALCSGSPDLDPKRSELVWNLLRKTRTLTFSLPPDYQQFEMPPEEEPSKIYLLESVPLVVSNFARGRRGAHDDDDDDDDELVIPAATAGHWVTVSGSVVQVEFEHSALALLGLRLELNLVKDSCEVVLGYLQPDEVAEVIALLADLVRTENARASRDGDGAQGVLVAPDRDVLTEAGRYLGGNRDMVSVVCDTMSFHMQDDVAASDDVAIAVLQSCVQFLHAVLPQCPGRVWSHVARCGLLNSETQAGKLGRLIGTLDLVLERYEFVLCTVQLLSAMVDSAMSSAVQRRCGNQFAYKQRGASNVWLGVADRILEQVCLAIAQAVIDMLENSVTWRFASEFHRINLVAELVPVLHNAVHYYFGIDDREHAEQLTRCLRPAANYVVDSFLEAAAGSLRFRAILGALSSAFNTRDSTVLPDRHRVVVRQLGAVCDLIKILLRVSAHQGRAPTAFESRLFKASTLVARLGSVSHAFKKPVLELLEVLVRTAGRAAADPPSLLGNLGIQTSKSFLHTLTRLRVPFPSTSEQTALWKFFSAIVANRQQWMSNCLLSGRTPRESLRNDERGGVVAEPSSESVLVTALERSGSLDSIDPTEALAALEFVTSALNHRPRTMMMMQKDTSFPDHLRSYVRNLRSPSVTAKSDVVLAGVQARLAAYAAQVFSMQLYHLRQMGRSRDLASKLVSDLDYFLRDAALISAYNQSLHANFSKNFANKYPGCTLEDLKRTMLEPRDLGKSFYYDLQRANDMLGFDPNWATDRATGFRCEMELANANLSLVDAQITLFHEWRVLLLELSSCLAGTPTLTRQLLQVTQQCLAANQENRGPEAIFVRINETRADLALMLVQRLNGAALAASEINSLLGSIYGNINGIADPFSAGSIPHTRTLLRLIYVTLRAFTASQSLGARNGDGASNDKYLVAITQTVLNLLDRIVGRGFRTLVALIHDPEASVSPEDLGLLTAILQACLCIPDIDQSQAQVLNIMAMHNVSRVATSLFSWADKLLVDGDDPIYGELSLLFLLELSALPLVAEQLACDGILGSIMSANIISYIMKHPVSPTAESAASLRCYGIWTKGLLPLMLNLLTAMGATVAPEVAYVLNQFPHLLQLSIDRFEAPGINRTAARDQASLLTLVSVSELHSLALLTRILAALRANNTREIPEVGWDAPLVLENVDFWLSTRRLLRERLLPLGQREIDWAGMPTGKRGEGQPENRLEERAVLRLEAVRDVLMDEA